MATKIENNPEKSALGRKANGGARKGAGRPLGTANAKTREIADKAAKEGVTPLEYMLEVMRNATHDLPVRLDAAKSAAPYIHAKLQSVTLRGDKESPLEVALGLSDADTLRKLARGG